MSLWPMVRALRVLDIGNNGLEQLSDHIAALSLWPRRGYASWLDADTWEHCDGLFKALLNWNKLILF